MGINVISESMSPMESEVYDIISKQYLKKHRDMSLETIYPFCFRILGTKYSQNELSSAVKNLISKHYFIKGSSLSRDDILKNSVRSEILQFIRVNPGCYNRLIRRRLSIGSNEFNWHLGLLEKFGLIKSMRFDRNIGYYENKNYLGHEYDLFLLQNDKVLKIIALLQNSKRTLSQIAKDLDIHYSTVQKYLEILTNREILNKKDIEKRIVYEVNEELLIRIRKVVNGAVFIDYAD
jgi:predicted transcriptional regulator